MSTVVRATDPLAVYGAALRRAAARGAVRLTAVDDTGRERALPVTDWCGGLLDGDDSIVRRCAGAVLDVGCGPGRLTAALAGHGHHVLGVDICPDAVRLANQRGARALRGDVFAPLPGEGTWRRVLVVDGNIGIAGDPVRLLRRCATLLTLDGLILVEAGPPGTTNWAGTLRLSVDGAPASAPFRWAYVGVGALAAVAHQAGLRMLETWTEAGRWFAGLSRR